MASVSQKIPNFLGGVSRQVDDQKRVNQLTECINGYPDPTFGLLKRPGMKYIDRLENLSGTPYTKTDLENAAWFYIDRAAAGSYIGCIKGTNIYIWRASDGAACVVGGLPNHPISDFLTGNGQKDYHFLAIQDIVLITNKTFTPTMAANPSFTENSSGTIRLRSVTNGDIHTVSLKGHSGGSFGPYIEDTSTVQSAATFKTILTGTNPAHELRALVKEMIEARHTANDSNFDGKWYLNSYADSLVIRRRSGTNGVVLDSTNISGTVLPFKLKFRGGVANEAGESFQDSITDVTKLPIESFDEHTVTILNSSRDTDDYYLKFVAFDGDDGEGYWQETKSPKVTGGFESAYMPWSLVNTDELGFSLRPTQWVSRQSGDDVTNPPPSIFTASDTDDGQPYTWTGKPITATFFFQNRLGLLSEDNVIFSAANDPYNFFARSALTQSLADPIDLNVSSIRPVKLTSVLPSSQGLLLFSEQQQFRVSTTDNSSLTPTTAYVTSLSNYEMNNDIAPVEIGTTTAFLSTVPGYSKLFTMDTPSDNSPPVVSDISKTVVEWIPDTIDEITASAPNSCVILTDRDTSYLYVFKYYSMGEQDSFQAWSKWKLPGNIQAARIVNNSLTVVTQYEDEYALGTIELDELPNGDVTASSTSYTGNVALDLTTRPVSPDGGTTAAVVYDSANDLTKIYVPFTPISGQNGTMLLVVPEADEGTTAELDADEGYYATAIPRTEQGTGYRYFEVNGDFSGYSDGIVVGYSYDLDVTLPKLYFQKQDGADFTASLIINRVELSTGRTGSIRFKVKPFGSNEWLDAQHTTVADVYRADNTSLVDEKIFTLPINQRNTHFELRITSDFPYPVSLVSMAWEGNYSPRYYQRA